MELSCDERATSDRQNSIDSVLTTVGPVGIASAWNVQSGDTVAVQDWLIGRVEAIHLLNGLVLTLAAAIGAYELVS